MIIRGKEVIIRLVLLTLFSLISVNAAALDPPHNVTNGYGCDTCHDVYSSNPKLMPSGDVAGPTIDDTIFNARCWSCHNPIGEAPDIEIKTHSSLTTDEGYGKWTVECWVCHTVHYQQQQEQDIDPEDSEPYGRNIRTKINLGYISYHDATPPKNGWKTVELKGPDSFTDTSGTGEVTGICQVCHTETSAWHNDGTLAGTGAHLGMAGSGCMGCHSHTDGFKAVYECIDCHQNAIGSRAAVGQQFSANSHHVQTGSTITSDKCYQCHWEADATGKLTSYHGAESDSTVDLVIYGAGIRPGSYTPGTTALLYTADGSRVQIQSLNTHCLSCHSGQNDLTEPFGDGKTPKEYAWDNNSIDARYSQLTTTPWGKYGGVGASPKNLRTKAYSAHGNAVSNEGGWDLSESWPDKRNGGVNVACYDCHNSHGSNVSGITTYYTSTTVSGGILKDTSSGNGGYTVTYKPTAGGSVGNKNEHNAGAALCFDCHLTPEGSAASKPWGYQDTFGASQAIIGYFDSEFLAPGAAGPQQRYAYKGLSVNAGGHFDASSPLNSTPMHNIDGLCTPCHDPHGISPSLGADQNYGVPMLKGTWLTSPYKEDVAPKNNVAGTARKEGVQYHLDQGTIPGNVISESDTQFAGLCLNCHQKNNLTDGTNGGTWKSVDRIHESVKGWGANTQHNYSCSKCHSPHIGSILPRLMVTNCLDPKHKGWLGNNPSSRTKGYGYGYYENYSSHCFGDSNTAGDCGSGSGDSHGYGNFPGLFVKNSGLPANPDTYVPPTLTGCHSNEAADHSWNNVTQWADNSPAPPQFPTLYNEPDMPCGTGTCGTTVAWHGTISPDGDTVQYMVEVDDNADFSSVDRSSAWLTTTSYYFTVPTDINGKTWYWRVKARDAVHTDQVSIWSPIDDFIISYQPSRPARIAEPDLECGSSCLVTLQWLAVTIADADPTEYYVEIDNNSDFNSPEYDSAGWIPGLSFDVTLPTQTSWFWRVRARDSVHTAIVSPWSVSDYFILTARPAGPTLINEGTNRCAPDCAVTLEWNTVTAPDGDAVEYRVQVDSTSHHSNSDWKTYSSTGNLQESSWISGTSWTVTVATDDIWYWHVQVRDAVHTTLSNSSSNDSFNTTGNPTTPTVVAEPDIICASGACLDITLEWNTVASLDGDIIEYSIEVDNNSDFSSPEYASGWITDIFYTVTVATGSNYYWRVQARDQMHPSWISSWSATDVFNITRSNPPPAPTLIAEPDFSSGGVPRLINLQWNAVTDPDGDPVEYYVQVDDIASFSNPNYTSGWITATNWDVTLAACTGWYWRVQARDANYPEAVSSWSSYDAFGDTFCGGSCPFLYVWDGEKFELETDIYGSGKLAAKSSSGYFKPYPYDYYVLENTPAEINGSYELRLVEERLEINYLDKIRLYAVDIPDSLDVYAEMPMFGESFDGIPSKLHTVDRTLQQPLSAIHLNSGTDILPEISNSDSSYATLNEDSNIGFEYQTIELDLGDLDAAIQIKLIVDAISVFPSTGEGIARKKQFGPRTRLEVPDETGQWISVPKEKIILPLPKALKRPFVMDISDIFMTDDYRVRLTFLFKTHIDTILFDTTPDEEMSITEIALDAADLRSYGLSEKQQLYDDIYGYVYNKDNPNHYHTYLPGNYTRFGDVISLLSNVDDKFVIYGNGDEVSLKFGLKETPPAGTERKYLLFSVGYYKDTTIDVEHAVEPMPFSGMSNFPYDPAVEHYPDDPEHTDYMETYNTRQH